MQCKPLSSCSDLKPFMVATLSAIALVASSLFAGTALAHHSGAMFDMTKEQSISGTVTEFSWTNPHSSFKVNVPDAAGKEQIWAIEMNGPQNLIRLGWKRTTIKAGDKVAVLLHPLRDGKPGGSFVSITLPDGRVLTGSAPGQNNAYTPAAPVAPGQ
jgi:Family of unknown function (DUF6152)